jgi:lipid II:glycine glycyltransferase (peptidoglycan interpeptide bridge formation enzyme)
MSITVKTIDKTTLQDFYNKFAGEKTFLQSAPYGDFREAVGEKNIRLGIFEKEKLVGTAQIQKTTTRLKTYLHCPHGPLFLEKNEEILKSLLSEYKKLGQAENCDLVRISPLMAETNGNRTLFKNNQFRPSAVHLVNPEKTWILGITPSEDELLMQMKKSTRYEVRRIGKCGIKVQMGNTSKDLDIFWALHEKTVKRQGFVPFPRKNTEKELNVFGHDCQIFSASIDQKHYSSSIILFDNKSAYYHQGASDYSKFPVAHATLWTAILEAKKRGCTEFNFWGICAEEAKKHPWYGLSRFKRGFGGEERNYLHVHDAPLTKKYWLNFALEKYRRWKKNY